jgi:hypothetical protein
MRIGENMVNHRRIRKRLSPFLILTALLLIGAVTPAKILSTSDPASKITEFNSRSAGILAGDVTRGQELFMGTTHLQNGGPPCMGCHNIDNNGLLGGGTLGPDLTDVSVRLGQAGLAEVIASAPGPVMAPIFADHPLTPQEQADLLAFLVASAGQPRSDRELILLTLSLAGLIAAAGLFGFLYRKRLRSVRGQLVKKAQLGSQGK